MKFLMYVVVLFEILHSLEAHPSDKPPSARLIGGHEAWPHSHPYIVSLQLNIFGLRVHYCGGSLLNHLWVLTAGHCVRVSWLYQLFPLDIAAGAHNIYYHDMMTQFRTVEKRVPHPQYTGGITEFDIALLKVNFPFEFTSAVQPIRLPDTLDSISKNHENLMIAGWGALKTTYFLPALPQLLQEVKVSYIPYKDCYRAFEDIEEEEGELLLKESVHICTGPLYGGVSACSGDSGGPLIEYVYVISSGINANFNFNDSVEDEYEAMDDDNSYTTPGSFWSRFQEMLEKYISSRDTVINSIERKELTAVGTDHIIDGLITARQDNKRIPVVIGIVSWGITPCGYKGAPSVYTNVSHYMDFIKEYINT